ncbi:MAG TPA: PKD domain-containing protein [Bacteroidia bacterium]|nr:PKD domain-containing protein [Bacteroidia bacterium]
MRKSLYCSLLFFISVTFSFGQSQSLYYDFRGTFNESSGASIALTPLGSGMFINDSLSELSCLQRTVYNFDYNNGVQFDNGAAGTFLGESYTIEMYFKFYNNGGYKRIIDFKNGTVDFGLYATPSILGFYDGLDVITSAYQGGQYAYLCITRDSASQNINMYIDGVLGGTFVDSLERGTIDTSQVLNFFRDDNQFGGEASPGTIAFLKLHNHVLSAQEVSDSYAGLRDTMYLLSFTQDITSSCLSGNGVNLTNTSLNDTTLISYTWDFGDGFSQNSIDAAYTYALPGVYTLSLIASDGGTCSDTSFSSIEIYPQPPVDLGPDLSVCTGDAVVLDAGGPYISYQWSDGSATQTISPVASGIFTVTVTDGNGCTGMDSASVVFNPLPLFSLPGDTIICAGDSVLLTAPGAMASYLWSTGETAQSIYVAVSGLFAAVITDSSGCSATDTIEITISASPVIDLGVDTAFCDGNAVTLDPGNGYAAYLWNDNSVGQTLVATVTGTYSVEVTDGLGCKGSDSINVIVNANPLVDLGADSTFCGGTPFTLDAGAGQTSYLWSDGSANQTLDILIAGLYTVTVTDANGCTAADSVVMSVNPPLNLGSDFTVCDGQPAVIDAGPGPAAYSWNTGETTQSILVTSSGTYGLSVTDGAGCINSDSITVVISTAPLISLGPDVTVCGNGVVTLDAGAGFSAYEWNDGSSLQTLDVTLSGNYIVTVTNMDGCTNSDTVDVSFYPLPVVMLYGDTTLCYGNTLLLDAGSGFSSYQWSDGSSAQTVVVNAATSGLYTVTVTDANGCTGSDSVNVDFYAAIPTPVASQIGPATLQSSSSGGNQWYMAGSGLISGATGQTYMPPQNGTYYVVVTDVNGCESLPSDSIVFINLGISAIGDAALQVYPNPVHGVLHVVTSGINGQEVSLTLTDLTGKMIFSKTIASNEAVEINLGQVAPGSYLLRFETASGTDVRRITVSEW